METGKCSVCLEMVSNEKVNYETKCESPQITDQYQQHIFTEFLLCDFVIIQLQQPYEVGSTIIPIFL